MTILSAKEAARELGIDARTFRKFMRDILDAEDQPGQGNRYHIDTKDIKKLKKKFEKWQRPKSRANGQGAVPTKIPDGEDEELDTEPEDFDEETIDEPSDDDLEDLELELDD